MYIKSEILALLPILTREKPLQRKESCSTPAAPTKSEILTREIPSWTGWSKNGKEELLLCLLQPLRFGFQLMEKVKVLSIESILLILQATLILPQKWKDRFGFLTEVLRFLTQKKACSLNPKPFGGKQTNTKCQGFVLSIKWTN